jgi:two-component system sensor histidine kinase/response regulator
MTVDVPMQATPGSRSIEDTPPPRPASARASVVLVVDDREDNRSAAQITLEAEGYRVALAACGEDAIAAFEAEQPDCILLDVRMPGLDGFGVCERIRGLPRGGDVPIIFLTALRDVETFDRALSVGGNDFLTKPMQAAELLNRVGSALKVGRLSAELREQYDLFKLNATCSCAFSSRRNG